MVINFNEDLTKRAKWGVVDQRDPTKIQVYCETPLSESEKSKLEAAIGVKIPSENYCGGKGAPSVSTGYTALAYIHEQVDRRCSLRLASDFPGLGEEVWFTLSNISSNEKEYYSEEWKQHGSRGFYACAQAGLMGELGSESFPMNDLAAMLKLLHAKPHLAHSIDVQTKINARSFVLCLDGAMEKAGYLSSKNDEITITIPEPIDFNLLSTEYNKICSQYSVGHYWINKMFLNDRAAEPTRSREAAIGMVLTAFRSCAKKSILSINLLKKYTITLAEKLLILKLMDENPYITRLSVPEDHMELQQIQQELRANLARNRWLKENGYLPPMADNFWRRASEYWTAYLAESFKSDEITDTQKKFQACIKEMGIRGLEALLQYLSTNQNDEQDTLRSLFRNRKPVFYAACFPEESFAYLNMLYQHLLNDYYFPFARVNLSLNGDNLLNLIKILQGRESIEAVIIRDCSINPTRTLSFVYQLIEAARKEQWTHLILIPELDISETGNPEIKNIIDGYRFLNNIISVNRRRKAAESSVKEISDLNTFRLEDTTVEIPSEKRSGQTSSTPVQSSLQQNLKKIREELGTHTWSLQTEGAVQLQFQQQQQIQQQRQIAIEQQKVQVNHFEELISGELVSFDNIDRLLLEYYNELNQEINITLSAAALGEPSETNLQKFFHTWISANPRVNAPFTIKYMTLPAAKMLLRHYHRLSAGLHLENLPKGFFTQRDKDGHLTLCYKPEIGYVKLPTPFTVDLLLEKPKAIGWKGDFRQFNLALYTNSNPLTEQDLSLICLFALLQPKESTTKNAQQEFAKIEKSLPSLKSRLSNDKEKIIKYWGVFSQAWDCRGEEGFTFLLDNLPKIEGLLGNQAGLMRIFFSLLPGEISAWILNSNLIHKIKPSAIGQLYNSFGEKAISLFLIKLMQIEKKLGEDFLNAFCEQFLFLCDSWDAFFTPAYFTTMDNILDKLRGSANKGKKDLWIRFCNHHMKSVGWERPETLWLAYEHFIAKLDDLGLVIEGHELNEISSTNMLVCADRIIDSLTSIPNPEQKELFWKSLKNFDLNEGGVPYALTHENFRYFDQDLELRNFSKGTPDTYSPNMAILYQWTQNLKLQIKRTLASNSRFSYEDYQMLCQELGNNVTEETKHTLVWLLHSDFPKLKTKTVLEKLSSLDQRVKGDIAKHLHQVVYQFQRAHIQVGFEAVHAFVTSNTVNWQPIFKSFPAGTFLEAITIAHQSKTASHADLLKLFSIEHRLPTHYSNSLREKIYLLVTLFGQANPDNLSEFFQLSYRLLPIVTNELHLLMTQIFSMEYEKSELEALKSPNAWRELISAIDDMQNNPDKVSDIRVQLIGKFQEMGLKFRYSRSGNYRALQQEDKPNDISFFVDHEARLWAFLKSHIAISADPAIAPKDQLNSVLSFFKRLQMNRTYLNEIEPLLSILEKLPQGYWTVEYFYDLLKALEPRESDRAFPMSLLKDILQEPTILGKAIDELENNFPIEIKKIFSIIFQNTFLTSDEQTKLCRLALREYSSEAGTEFVEFILNQLSNEYFKKNRDLVLNILLESTSLTDAKQRFQRINQHIQIPSHTFESIKLHWHKSLSIWLNLRYQSKLDENLLLSLERSFDSVAAEKRASILHILIWSTLKRDAKNSSAYVTLLERKAPKLINKLDSLTLAELEELAATYPKVPFFNTETLLTIIKEKEKGMSFSTVLEKYQRSTERQVRSEHGTIVATREIDLARMIRDARVSKSGQKTNLTATQTARLTLRLNYLKQLENGQVHLEGFAHPISKMTSLELQKSYVALSSKIQESTTDDWVYTQLWAVLFESLGRTTGKYPHLAQQFAIFAKEIGVQSDSTVLQLATGEGKSHYVALRAAYYQALGKTVEICTAKGTLAERDLKDYEDFFSLLAISAVNLEAKSDHSAYTNSKIHYTTLGNLSLFLDEQSYRGTPIKMNKKDRVILIDEFDFCLFQEGISTGYNYALPTGRTPKQMTWFYQAVNIFYKEHYETFKVKEFHVNCDNLCEFLEYLHQAAGQYEERCEFIDDLCRNPLTLVKWLKAAASSYTLQMGAQFTVLEQNIVIGEESYPMREIVPLTIDNQRMVGSTFSDGVHELLAVRLNAEARDDNEPQNFHVHPESLIISSQVAAERVHQLTDTWEGFSGTISSLQSRLLAGQYATEVMHVPTNQIDLRHWHKPQFFDNPDNRFRVMVNQIKECLTMKKSILFCGQNDREVAELKTQLAAVLTEEELKNFIFYTNDENRSAQEVLDEKEEKESHDGLGKKTNAMCLMASGFGRGDNPGVEVVLFFNVRDESDLFQKGGRTARNGAFGEVFQFYLISEIQMEHQKLSQLNNIEKPMPEDPQECFDELLQLRELTFLATNLPNISYHQILAAYSTWIMDFLAGIQDPLQKEKLPLRITADLEQLAKNWLSILNDKSVPKTEDKFNEISRRFLVTGEAFLRGFGEFNPEMKSFQSPTFCNYELTLHTSKDHLTKDFQLLSRISVILSRCHRLGIGIYDQMLQWLKELDAIDNGLVDFVDQAEKINDPEAIVRCLNLVWQQKTTTSTVVSKFVDEVKIAATEFHISMLSPQSQMRYLEYFNLLTPKHRENLLDYMQDATVFSSIENRFLAIMPILSFITRFNFQNEVHAKWQQEYFENLFTLASIGIKLQMEDLQQLPALSYRHFMSITQLKWRYNLKSKLVDLHHIISNDPVERLRLLNSIETLAVRLDSPLKNQLIESFCDVASHLTTLEKNECLKLLIKITNAYWLKGENKHTNTLVEIWFHLANNKEYLTILSPFISWALGLVGKASIIVLSICLQHLSGQKLSDATNAIQTLWPILFAQNDNKKSDKFARLESIIKIVAELNEPLGENYLNYLMRLCKLNLNNEIFSLFLLHAKTFHNTKTSIIDEQNNLVLLDFAIQNNLIQKPILEISTWLETYRSSVQSLVRCGYAKDNLDASTLLLRPYADTAFLQKVIDSIEITDSFDVYLERLAKLNLSQDKFIFFCEQYRKNKNIVLHQKLMDFIEKNNFLNQNLDQLSSWALSCLEVVELLSKISEESEDNVLSDLLGNAVKYINIIKSRLNYPADPVILNAFFKKILQVIQLTNSFSEFFYELVNTLSDDQLDFFIKAYVNFQNENLFIQFYQFIVRNSWHTTMSAGQLESWIMPFHRTLMAYCSLTQKQAPEAFQELSDIITHFHPLQTGRGDAHKEIAALNMFSKKMIHVISITGEFNNTLLELMNANLPDDNYQFFLEIYKKISNVEIFNELYCFVKRHNIAHISVIQLKEWFLNFNLAFEKMIGKHSGNCLFAIKELIDYGDQYIHTIQPDGMEMSRMLNVCYERINYALNEIGYLNNFARELLLLNLTQDKFIYLLSLHQPYQNDELSLCQLNFLTNYLFHESMTLIQLQAWLHPCQNALALWMEYDSGSNVVAALNTLLGAANNYVENITLRDKSARLKFYFNRLCTAMKVTKVFNTHVNALIHLNLADDKFNYLVNIYNLSVTLSAPPHDKLRLMESMNQKLLDFIIRHHWHINMNVRDMRSWITHYQLALKALVDRGANCETAADFLINTAQDYLQKMQSNRLPDCKKMEIYFSHVTEVIQSTESSTTGAAILQNYFRLHESNDVSVLNRLIFMRLLRSGLLVMNDSAVQTPTWTQEYNQTIFENALRKYKDETAGILFESKHLTSAQELNLLRLSRELEESSRLTQPMNPQPLNAQAEQDNRRKFHDTLMGKLNRYSARWFRSAQRKESVAHLQGVIGQAITNNVNNPVGYAHILTILQQAQMNMIIHATWKEHGSRNSSFLDTLNEMQHAVVTHWIKDKLAIQDFTQYRHLQKNTLLQMTQHLQVLVQNYKQSKYLENDDPRGQQFRWKVSMLFANLKHRDALTECIDRLTQFNANQVANNLFTANDIERIEGLVDLISHLPKLPNHILIVCREIQRSAIAARDFLHKEHHLPSLESGIQLY